jgi:hypothetical protein
MRHGNFSGLLLFWVLLLLSSQVCQGQDEEEFPSVDEESILILATAACPAGSTPSLTTRCNTTRFTYPSGCKTTVIQKSCPKPAEGSDCSVKTVVLENPFEGGPRQLHNITCLTKQRCGPLKNVPPLSVSSSFRLQHTLTHTRTDHTPTHVTQFQRITLHTFSLAWLHIGQQSASSPTRKSKTQI